MTPATSNSEETHNTLKFAHRSKHVEVKASQNKVDLLFSNPTLVGDNFLVICEQYMLNCLFRSWMTSLLSKSTKRKLPI